MAEPVPITNPPRLFRGLKIVSAMTLLSRILGLIRDIAMASQFGIGPVMDAFTVAFRVPNLARKLFGEGALATAFMPVLVRECARKDRSDAWRLSSAVFVWLTLFLSVIVLMLELTLWGWGVWFQVTDETRLLLVLTAAMLPYLVLVCLACQISAVLNALGHFTWPAIVPVVLNAIWIAGVWLIVPWFTSQEIQALVEAWCIVFAGVVQILVQLPTLYRLGYRFTWDFGPVRPQTREILTIMAPVIVGLSITQINTFTDSMIALGFSAPEGVTESWHPIRAGAVSSLYFGERLYQFPLGIFGVALGTVIFPLLSRHAAEGNHARLREDLELGMRLVIVIGLPASVGLMVLAHPISRCLFEHGRFHAEDALRTAWVIATYGCGVWAYCAIQILQRGFYALGDRTAPLRIGLIVVGINFLLNLILIWPFAELGLALSTAFCAALQVGGLVAGLEAKLGRWNWRSLARTALKTLLACAAMSGAAWLGMLWFPSAGKFLGLLIPCTLACGAFLIAGWVLRLEELRLLLRRERAA